MCGIVGLHLRNPELADRLGELLTPMLISMGRRGPDSAGIAIYQDVADDGVLRWSLRAPRPGYDWGGLAERLSTELEADVDSNPVADDAVLFTAAEPDDMVVALAEWAPEAEVVSYGESIEVYKDVGDPAEICQRYGVAERSGYQGLGHTRMATESAVTTDHSHPFAVGPDLCLVHNGSFSNYASVRRDLAAEGVHCDTDNDSEVAARFLALHVAGGDDLEKALRRLMEAMDGFYTLLVATADQFAIVRDAFACKPAVIAETNDYVAMAGEYHALATLPGVESARVFEPMPEEIHVWSR